MQIECHQCSMDGGGGVRDGSSDQPAGQPTMTTVSRHFFGEDLNDPAFSISIIENMKEEYGLFVWPCSVVLAEYVWQQRSRFSGMTVVELGAGTSLPGLVAAKLGSDVTLTDDAGRYEVLENMRRVCELNDLNCKVIGLTWGVWDEPIFSLCPQIIIGADVLYDASAFDDLFATVSFLLQNSPSSVFITTYHNRSGHHLIEFLMVKWGLKCAKLFDGFSILPPNKASGISGNIQLAEIVMDGNYLDEATDKVSPK
ncbi:methyltransferase-like protein 23 isoform X2 [Punica granatum]|uniref:Methyltransferase-like protein 23 isoform X2 n=2 Tax=Punica granatum TaxID=22663 RepID=A0A6P8E5T2_PUNGR|nr:methyltransferase-like protein 23 isoform X2 [Punica granatum]